ncbi:hypothetical protein AGMMS49921_12130 [Endomicrobiia bacterium]|nr:hypothetical protein AGMMS49921_12130 [Endomicrobiia bacterium]
MKDPNESILKKCLRIFKRFWVDGSGLTIQAILFLFIAVIVLVCLDASKDYLKKRTLFSDNRKSC